MSQQEQGAASQDTNEATKKTERVLLDIDLTALEDRAGQEMKENADFMAFIPDTGELTPEEKLKRKKKESLAYQAKLAGLRGLEEVLGGRDFRSYRGTKNLLPSDVRAVITDLQSEFVGYPIHEGMTQEQIARELTDMVEKGTLSQEILLCEQRFRKLNTEIQSETGTKKVQTPSLRPQPISGEAEEHINSMLGSETAKAALQGMQRMPEVSKRESFFGRIKRVLRG